MKLGIRLISKEFVQKLKHHVFPVCLMHIVELVTLLNVDLVFEEQPEGRCRQINIHGGRLVEVVQEIVLQTALEVQKGIELVLRVLE